MVFMLSVSAAIERLTELATGDTISHLGTIFSAHGKELAVVGGTVRDAFLGRESNDLDFATNATVDEITAYVTPISEAVWDVGRDFGTIAAKIGGVTVEITRYRADSYDENSRKPDVTFAQTLEEDLWRRDFTINALAFRVPEQKLVDPSGGVEDLLSMMIKTPLSADVSFTDDPLRMMRAARFVSQLGFELDPEVQLSLAKNAHLLRKISAERVRDELVKLVLTDQPRRGLDVFVETNLAEIVLPELPALKLESDEHHHHKDVYVHSLTVLEQAISYEKSRGILKSPDLIVRLAALLHDIGKPATKKLLGKNTVTFHNHDLVGARLTAKRLRALRFDNDTISSVSRLVELHLRFFGYTEQSWTDSAVRRYVRDADKHVERLHILSRADVTTRNKRKADRLSFAYDDLESRIEALHEQEELDAMRPELDGTEIMQILGVKPGKHVGDAYHFLLDIRLDEGLIGKERVAEKLRTWWEGRVVSREYEKR